jgi:hypothetical protein
MSPPRSSEFPSRSGAKLDPSCLRTFVRIRGSRLTGDLCSWPINSRWRLRRCRWALRLCEFAPAARTSPTFKSPSRSRWVFGSVAATDVSDLRPDAVPFGATRVRAADWRIAALAASSFTRVGC